MEELERTRGLALGETSRLILETDPRIKTGRLALGDLETDSRKKTGHPPLGETPF